MTFLDPDKLTWTCMVCGDLRADYMIAVAKHAVEHDGKIVPGATYNQRYCTDRPACVEVATRPGPYVIGAK